MGKFAAISDGVKPALAKSSAVKPDAFKSFAPQPAYLCIDAALMPANRSRFITSGLQPASLTPSGVTPVNSLASASFSSAAV